MAESFTILAGVFFCLHAAAVDGDTIRCEDGRRVRVWGIQAPERYEPAGPASTRAMGSLITGKTLQCERKGPDSYNRIVARCLVDGRDVAGEMVRQGRAVDWPRFSHGAYARVRP